MNVLLILIFLFLVASVGGVYISNTRGRIGMYTAGVEFVLLGAFLSSDFFPLLTDKVLNDLFPFIHIELGWIGLLYGIQFEWRIFKRQRISNLLIMNLQAVVTMAAIIFLATGLLLLRLPVPLIDILPAAVVLAVAASISSPWIISIVYEVLNLRNPLTQRLRRIAVLDNIPGLLLFSIPFLVWQSSWNDIVIRIFAGLFVGMALGMLTVLLMRDKKLKREPLLVLIGVALLTAGVSFKLGMPVIFVSVISGIAIANAKPTPRDLYPIIGGFEHALYLLFLILAGAMWNPNDVFALALALTLLSIRLITKWWTFSISKPLVNLQGWGGHLSLALLSPGGMAVAMAVNFVLCSNRFMLTQLVLDTIIWSFVLLNPLGVIFAYRSLLMGERNR